MPPKRKKRGGASRQVKAGGDEKSIEVEKQEDMKEFSKVKRVKAISETLKPSALKEKVAVIEREAKLDDQRRQFSEIDAFVLEEEEVVPRPTLALLDVNRLDSGS
jgi:hypothetical protein